MRPRGALKGAFEPILASAGTVIVGLLCLLLSDLNSNKALGPVAAIGIAFAFVAAMTMLPALLLLAGRTAFWPLRPKVGSATASATAHVKGLWAGLGRGSANDRAGSGSSPGSCSSPRHSAVTQLKASGVPQSDRRRGLCPQARDGPDGARRALPEGRGQPRAHRREGRWAARAADTALRSSGCRASRCSRNRRPRAPSPSPRAASSRSDPRPARRRRPPRSPGRFCSGDPVIRPRLGRRAERP